MPKRTTWWDSFMGFISYTAVILIGIALLLSRVLPASAVRVANAFELIALILSIIVVGFASFFFASRRPRNRVWWMVSWAIAITLIIVAFLVGWIG